jgi:hypothetical protein
MRGMGQTHAIESVTFRHEEGNEGEKIGVKRGFLGFFGAKLLKRQGGIVSEIGTFPSRLRKNHFPSRECDLSG